MEAESLLLVLELDHVAGFEKALQSYRGERVIFHGPSEFLARTGKKLGHGTQVGVKANRLRVNQLLDRAARIVGEVLRQAFRKRRCLIPLRTDFTNGAKRLNRSCRSRSP